MDAEWRRVLGVRRPLTNPDGSPDRDGAAVSLGASTFTAVGGFVTAALVWMVDGFTTAQRAGVSAVLVSVACLALAMAAFALRRVRRSPADPAPPPVRRRAVIGWGVALAISLVAMAVAPVLDLGGTWTVELFFGAGFAACLALAGLLRSTVWR